MSWGKLGQLVGIARLARSCHKQSAGERSSSQILTNFAGLRKMSFNVNSSSVQHDALNKYFFITLDNKDAKAVLKYELYEVGRPAATVMDMHHTEVPVAMQGKGIAQILAKAAMEHAVANDFKMKLTCTYLQSYVKKNPNSDYVSRLIDS